jgi:hypothetical protein
LPSGLCCRRAVSTHKVGLNCWQLLFSQARSRTSAPSAPLQSATSATFALFGFSKRTQPLSVSATDYRWQAHWCTFAEFAVDHSDPFGHVAVARFTSVTAFGCR